jgi:hypothetical protein
VILRHRSQPDQSSGSSGALSTVVLLALIVARMLMT